MRKPNGGYQESKQLTMRPRTQAASDSHVNTFLGMLQDLYRQRGQMLVLYQKISQTEKYLC